MTTDLLDLPYDPRLDEGAKNAVYTCLDIQPDERVALITDRETLEVGAALATQLAEAAGHVDVVILEDVADRPVLHLPLPMGNALEQADVSIFAATALPGELAMRRAMTDIVNAGRMRHGHMVGITHRIMLEGMRADYRVVAELTQWVCELASRAREITCETPAGTAIRAVFDPAIRWIPTPGIITPDKWGNLPGGETFTAPARVDGVFVVDGVLGSWMALKYGDLRDTQRRHLLHFRRLRPDAIRRSIPGPGDKPHGLQIIPCSGIRRWHPRESDHGGDLFDHHRSRRAV